MNAERIGSKASGQAQLLGHHGSDITEMHASSPLTQAGKIVLLAIGYRLECESAATSTGVESRNHTPERSGPSSGCRTRYGGLDIVRDRDPYGNGCA